MTYPPPYEVRLSSAAARQVRRLSRPTWRQIDEHLRHEAARVGDPQAGRGGKAVKLVHGQHGRVHRLRVGTWRVLYELDHELRVLRVDAVVPRRDLERWLRDH
jgi:mRNA-degrading endonuclease RelE of RelBE toxin-antitoxin system